MSANDTKAKPLASHLDTTLRLRISKAEQPHGRPPTPVCEEVAWQQRGERGCVRIAVVVGSPPTMRLVLSTWRLEQLAEEGLGGLDQQPARFTVDRVAPLLEHSLLD